MVKYCSALFCALLVLSILDPIKCGRGYGGRSGGFGRGGGSHGYPSSHGLSGSGRGTSGGLSGGGHGYPSSGGSSGSHGYPSSGGSHGYPSSGGSHGYPSSGGLSGSGGSHSVPSSNSHGYPSSGGKHSYPSSSGGLSGSGSQSHGYPASRPQSTHTTTVHHHYHYSPPKQISYAAPGYSRPQTYPVYQGSPPTYVYQYKNSGSKYGTLLAGLALLNLGTLAGAAYAHSRSHQSTYKPEHGEVCKFGVKKDNGDYEETKIDCQLISSFIYEEQARTLAKSTGTGGTNSVVTTTVTNTTIVNSTNTGGAALVTPPPEIHPTMLANGTLVLINQTVPGVPNATNIAANGTVISSVSVTTTTTNTTVTNALDVKGKEVVVTPTMQCFVIRTTPSTNMRKNIPCGLLQTYATQSLKRNSAARTLPTFTILCAIAAFVIN